ncbi:MAG: MgtC/SapB family protein, partial [Victivallales bacterium]|nr:MgtC/SapB family protein [Victivallales bacterium]
AGNSKEISSVFFAMAVGLALGMGHILFAAVITAITVFVILFLSKTNIFNLAAQPQTLEITIPEDLDYTHAFDAEFKRFTTHHELVRSKTTNMGSLYQLTYDVCLKKSANEKEFMDAIRVKNSNLKVLLSHVSKEQLI